MRHSLLRTILIVVLGIVLVSCQPVAPQPPSTPENAVQDIRVVLATEPTKTTTKVEQFPLPNCGGSDKLTQGLRMYASASKSATVGARAGIKGGGEVAIPETVKLKLEIQVEASYQKTFESANSRLDSIEMSAAAGTHVIYTIVWEEQAFTSIVRYSANSQVYEAPYTYKLVVPKIDKSYSVACPSDNAEQKTVVIVVTATAQPQVATPPTATRVPPTPVQAQQEPAVIVRASDVIPKIKGEDGEIERILSWWRVDDWGNKNGQLNPSSFVLGETCFGLAWNTNEFGNLRLIVFQKPSTFTFADGGWYVKVCVPKSIQISPEDVGRIQADWLSKRYGTGNDPWEIRVK